MLNNFLFTTCKFDLIQLKNLSNYMNYFSTKKLLYFGYYLDNGLILGLEHQWILSGVVRLGQNHRRTEEARALNGSS